MDELKNAYIKYERVRRSGKYNMLSAEAIKATGLSENEYYKVINNYTVLNKKYEGELNNG